MSLTAAVAMGFKGFPDCPECQCYPECRVDCPDREKCLDALPHYQTKLDRAKRYAADVRKRREAV
jgi:hypothetical protein